MLKLLSYSLLAPTSYYLVQYYFKKRELFQDLRKPRLSAAFWLTMTLNSVILVMYHDVAYKPIEDTLRIKYWKELRQLEGKPTDERNSTSGDDVM